MKNKVRNRSYLSEGKLLYCWHGWVPEKNQNISKFVTAITKMQNIEHVRVCRKFKKKAEKRWKQEIYYKKSRGEQEKIVSRKSDENRREQEKIILRKSDENRRNYFKKSRWEQEKII
jgi:hypothetical protein